MPRLLILSTTFYPDPVVGAVRMTQWARATPDFGWETEVLCRHYGYDATPERFAEDVHPETHLHYLGPKRSKPASGSAAPQAGGWKGFAKDWLEKTLVPDVVLLSWRRLAAEAEEKVDSIRPDVILSSGPQHSIHWLGERLAKRVGAKWAADFRDPYLIDVRFQPQGWRKPLWFLHKRFERWVYDNADLTIHAIPLHGRWARRTYPDRKGPAEVLENGAPSGLAELAAQRLNEPPRQRLSLRSVGHLSPQAPALLAEAIERLGREGIDLEFRHAGRVPATVDDLPTTARESMTFLGPVPHPEAIRLVAGADLLVAFLSEERSRVLGVSSKLFEFLATGRPVLAINPTRTDRMLLRREPGCEVLSRPGLDEVVGALRRMAEAARAKPAGSDFAERYDRRRQVAQLAGWLDRMVS